MTANLGRWPTGEHRILDLLSRGALERVPGDPRYTRDLIDRAGVKLRSAKVLAGADPETAYIVAYDAARFLLTALLAAQGLRPKASPEGGHRTVQDAIDAQFPGRFRFFGRMRGFATSSSTRLSKRPRRYSQPMSRIESGRSTRPFPGSSS